MLPEQRRRHPQQPRSQATVDAITEAAAEILSSSGYAALSTNRVAQRGGVGVGSVYEYFRDKDAIVDWLLERFARELRLSALAAFEAARSTELSGVLDAISRAVVACFRKNPALHRELLTRIPHRKAGNPLDRTEKDISARMSALLQAHAADLRLPDLERCAAIAVRSGRHLIEDSLVDRTFPLELAHVEPELSALVRGYLLR